VPKLAPPIPLTRRNVSFPSEARRLKSRRSNRVKQR
jgi:hypothetical protein